jgi:hypothetical protein
MNNISYTRVSDTFSQVVIAAIFSNLLTVPAVGVGNVSASSISNRSQNSYTWKGNNSTFDSYQNSSSRKHDLTAASFENEVSNFYGNLLAHQERLGAEFEKILNENMWDLYES